MRHCFSVSLPSVLAELGVVQTLDDVDLYVRDGPVKADPFLKEHRTSLNLERDCRTAATLSKAVFIGWLVVRGKLQGHEEFVRNWTLFRSVKTAVVRTFEQIFPSPPPRVLQIQ